MNDLTQRHRAQQLLLRRATIAEMERLWPRLEWERLDATYPAFAVAAAALVQRNRMTSAGVAAQYLRTFRRAQGVRGAVKIVLPPPLIVDQFGATLHSTSVAPLKAAAARGTVPAEAMTNALTLAQGSMSRLVLDAGRDTTLLTLQRDPEVSGWRRVVGSDACAFCRGIAGRGNVYSAQTADFGAHGGCGCSAEPAYGVDRRKVREYTPSQKFKSQSARDANNARIRGWLDESQATT